MDCIKNQHKSNGLKAGQCRWVDIDGDVAKVRLIEHIRSIHGGERWVVLHEGRRVLATVTTDVRVRAGALKSMEGKFMYGSRNGTPTPKKKPKPVVQPYVADKKEVARLLRSCDTIKTSMDIVRLSDDVMDVLRVNRTRTAINMGATVTSLVRWSNGAQVKEETLERVRKKTRRFLKGYL